MLTDPDEYAAPTTALPHSGNAPIIDANGICVYFAFQIIEEISNPNTFSAPKIILKLF